MNVRDKAVLVTGAASGIGRASALLLARNGARVIAADRNADGAERVAAEIRAEGATAHPFAVDIGDSGQVAGLVQHTVDALGRIDVLVHAAGVCPRCTVLDMSDEAWRDVLRVNLDGTFYVTRDVARVMVGQRAGTMVLLTSDRGVYGSIDYAHYAASKGGMIALTRSMAMAVGKYGVTINGINPGMTDTPMGRSAVTQWEEKTRLDVLGSDSRPEEIAETVLFLAGKGGAYMTGQIIGTRVRHGA
jgi:3-oxoacyl-[acyl-carrier protein] reductase